MNPNTKQIVHCLADSPFAEMIHEFFAKNLPEFKHLFLVDTKSPAPPKWASNNDFTRLTKESLTNALSSQSRSTVLTNGLAVTNPSLRAIPSKVPRIWSLWGHEFYGHPSFQGKQRSSPPLLQPQTAKITHPYQRSIPRRAGSNLRKRIKALLPDRTKRAFNEFDFICCLFNEEYELIRSNLKFSTPRYHKAGVVGLEQLIRGESHELTGSNILLGNSASATNNHAEAISLIHQIGIPETASVIVPLSYGSDNYREIIRKLLLKELPSNSRPITQFMPLPEYNKLVSSCSILIMNHGRQQALGNIIAALYRGAIVYLNRTPVYTGLRRMGIDVRLIKELNCKTQFSERLDQQQIDLHRKRLRDHIGENVIGNSYRTLFNSLL